MLGRAALTVHASPSSIALADTLVVRYAGEANLPDAVTAQLRTAVGCLVRFSVEHSYEGRGGGEIEVAVELDATGVRVDVRDRGKPFRRAGGPDGPLPPGLEAAHAIDPETRLVNLAHNGKRLTLHIDVEHGAPITQVGEGAADETRSRGADVALDDIEVRDATPDDSTAIAQLLYRNYGLDYVHREMYRPVWIEEAMRDGRMSSTVAYVGDELVGHHAFLAEGPGQAAETGVAVVARDFRGLGLFDAMFDVTVRRATAAGVPALCARALTAHVFSQRAEYKHGYHPIAIELGAVPAAMASGQSADGTAAERGTALFTTKRIADTGPRPARIPDRYVAAIGRLAGEAGIEFADPVGLEPLDLSQEIEYRDEEGNAFLRVSGEGDLARLERMLWSDAAREASTIYADLDLTCDCDDALEALRGHGFFLCGFRHFGHGGREWLRLQRLQDQADLERIALEGETANWLFAEALADRDSVS
ncbi:MAG: ATP-binding protein [Gaiellales bacterium]